MIQEKYLNRADEINAMLVKKHEAEQMRLVQEKLDIERQFQSKDREMTAEIERLQKVGCV